LECQGAVDDIDNRWCTDGFEIPYDSGEVVTNTVVKDSCDREIVAWRAWPGRGLPGDLVREMPVQAVEGRFGSIVAVPGGHRLEFLSGNGGANWPRPSSALSKIIRTLR